MKIINSHNLEMIGKTFEIKNWKLTINLESKYKNLYLDETSNRHSRLFYQLVSFYEKKEIFH